LRAILGGRVRKSTGAKRSSPSKASPSPRGNPSSSSTPRRKSRAGSADDDEDYIGDDKLDDCGLLKALATDLNLRDTTQAIMHIRAHMFSPLPERAAGMSSTQISEVLNYRKHSPPIVTVSHIQTLLLSPSAVDREVAELVRSGFIRKMVIARRDNIGETLILAADLEEMIEECTKLPSTTRAHFKTFLEDNPGAQAVPRDVLSPFDIDNLFTAGFLTARHLGMSTRSPLSNTVDLYSRPEDKSTLVSIENISKQATGTLGTVGGAGALHMAGGSGGRSRIPLTLPPSVTELRLAVPGTGAFLKLVSSAVEHFTSLLSGSRFREAPETVLRDRWNGGAAKDEAHYATKRARGEFAGILPGHTRKWKQFRGLSFDWVLEEAVGSGLVEVFETGSVGRGVRVI
jgi:hypothetical protein